MTFRGLGLQLDQLDSVATPALALGSPSYLDAAVQQQLLDYVRVGDRLLPLPRPNHLEAREPQGVW